MNDAKVSGSKDRHDHRITTVLQALGDAAPPVDMEQRITAALRHAEEPVRQNVPSSLAGWWSANALRVALPSVAALATLVVAVATLGLHGRQPLAPAKKDPAGKAAVGAAGMPLQPQAIEAPHGTISATHTPASVTNPRATRRNAGVRLSSYEPAAHAPREEQDRREGSFPAPPEPMTEQERLLVKLARRNDPVLLASLDPVAREAELKREREEVRKFFTPVPSPAEGDGQP